VDDRRLAEAADVLDKQQPDVLADVVDVLAIQLVLQADGPHKRGVALDELVPRRLVALADAGDQGSDRRVIAHRVSFPGRGPYP